MQDVAVQHWKKILETMVSRNRNRLGEAAYLVLTSALESGNNPHALRKLALDTAAALGRLEGRRTSMRTIETTLEHHLPSTPPRPSLSHTLDVTPQPVADRSAVRPRHRSPAPRQ